MIDCSKTKNYFTEKKRMIKKHKYICELNCAVCPLGWSKNGKGISCETLEKSYPEQAISIIQKWSDENSQRTYLTEFLEHYPNAEFDKNGVPKICPHLLGLKDSYDSCKGGDCAECWNQPLSEREEVK